MDSIKSREVIRLVGGIITGVVGLLAVFGIVVDPVLQEKALEIVTAVAGLLVIMWPLLEWARKNVWSKDTAKVLANGVNERNPSEASKRAAAEVLDQPPPAERSAAGWALEVAKLVASMTPGEIDDYILNYGVDAFESAMKLLKRVPDQAETNRKALEGL